MQTDNKIEKKIITFIKEHHVLTLATAIDNQPWCCNCFYAFNADNASLIFTSDFDTKHIENAILNKNIAGSIVLETSIIGKIQGIQFTGILTKPEHNILETSKKIYLKRFPFTALMNTNLWLLELNLIKMTDNRLGFGKKIFWTKKEDILNQQINQS